MKMFFKHAQIKSNIDMYDTGAETKHHTFTTKLGILDTPNFTPFSKTREFGLLFLARQVIVITSLSTSNAMLTFMGNHVFPHFIIFTKMY